MQKLVSVRRLIYRACLAALLCPGVQAQSLQGQWWPEIDTYVGLNRQIRVMFEASKTVDGAFGYDSADIGPTLEITLKPILRRRIETNNSAKQKYLTFGVGYRYVPTVDKPSENRIELDLTPRYILPKSILLSNRNRGELRDIGGKYSWRYRPRLTLERNFEIKAVSFAPYAEGELYYDSRYGIWNKNRYEFGVTFPVRRRLDVKPYYAHSNDGRSSIPHVNAAGLTVSLYFRKG